MAGTQLVTGYRLNAANCFDLAKEFPDPERKLALLDMAAAWLRLAEITEEFNEALVVDRLEARPSPNRLARSGRTAKD
jgi:hypothetical protein